MVSYVILKHNIFIIVQRRSNWNLSTRTAKVFFWKYLLVYLSLKVRNVVWNFLVCI